MSETTYITTMPMPHEERLSLEVVVRVVAGVDETLARRAVDHDDAGDAEGDEPAGQSEVQAVLRADAATTSR